MASREISQDFVRLLDCLICSPISAYMLKKFG